MRRLRDHVLRGGWGHKNSKASRRALTMLVALGYERRSDKYLLGAHRLVREAVAEHLHATTSKGLDND